MGVIIDAEVMESASWLIPYLIQHGLMDEETRGAWRRAYKQNPSLRPVIARMFEGDK